jgi:exodeoxyribonuclease V alpha subunit
MATPTISKDRMAELLAKVRAAKLSASPSAPTPISQAISGIGKHGEAITYNKEQTDFITLATLLKSCILIGAAGTGKTTCMMGAITSLIQSGSIPIMQDTGGHKYLNSGTSGIVACSYTRRAVSNLRKAMPAGMTDNCITIHKLLEYQPDYFEIDDPVTGETKTSMRFVATRNAFRPLPSTIKTIIIDESSMVSVELFRELESALPHGVQWIFLGDIQQLPPVFGSAILGYKMLELPTVELTQVYRQALESPIIKYATQIKDGIQFSVPEKLVEETSRGKITFHPWKKKLHSEVALHTFCKFCTTALDQGGYNTETDCILVPFNKAFGTIEINRHIANHVAKKAGRPVWEVIAGFNKLYFSVGDKVLYDKEDAVITEIEINPTYLGKKPQKESVTLDYWGFNSTPRTQEQISLQEEEIDFMLDQMASFTGKDDERVRAASHKVTVQLQDSGQYVEMTSAADLNSLLISYALTIHKSQGSEWDKVFLVLQQSHATMIQRELLYTAVTRAAKELYVICEPDSFEKGVASQRIKGNTLAEKAQFFMGKLETNGGVY